MHGTHRRAHTPLIALRDGSTPGAAGAAWPLRPATSPSILPAAFSLGPLSLPGSRARPCTRATYGAAASPPRTRQRLFSPSRLSRPPTGRGDAIHITPDRGGRRPLGTACRRGRPTRAGYATCGWLMPMTVLSSSRSATDWAVGEEAAAELACGARGERGRGEPAGWNAASA